MAKEKNPKKRKRREDDDGDEMSRQFKLSRKQQVFQWNEAERVESGPLPPFIIRPAPGVNIPDDIHFLVYARKLKDWELPNDDPTAIEKREYKLYSNEDAVFEFIGEEDTFNRGRKIFVGAEDDAGTKKMMQIKQMVVRSIIKGKKAKDQQGDSTDEERDKSPKSQSKTIKREELALEFGASKTKRSIETARSNKVMPVLGKDGQPRELSAAALATLQQIEAASANMVSRDELAARAEAQKPIPPPNKEAKVIQDVYRPAAFIGNSILDAIDVSDWLEAAQSGTAVELPSRFVASRLNAVARGVDPSARLRLLRYLLYLVIFFAKSEMRGRGRRMAPPRRAFNEAAQAAELVVDQIRHKFTDGEGGMTNHHVSLLMTHVLCLAAIVENFEFDMQHLRMDLGQSQDAMTAYFQELGGKVRQSKAGGNTRYLAKLALPLVFPRVGGPKRRAKR